MDTPVVADFNSLQTDPGKDADPSEPNKSLTDTEHEFVMPIARGRARTPCYSSSRWIRERYKRRRS